MPTPCSRRCWRSWRCWRNIEAACVAATAKPQAAKDSDHSTPITWRHHGTFSTFPANRERSRARKSPRRPWTPSLARWSAARSLSSWTCVRRANGRAATCPERFIWARESSNGTSSSRVPDTSTPLVLYCGGGYRSALAADNLQKMGYTNVESMDGGVRGWRRGLSADHGVSNVRKITSRFSRFSNSTTENTEDTEKTEKHEICIIRVFRVFRG